MLGKNLVSVFFVVCFSCAVTTYNPLQYPQGHGLLPGILTSAVCQPILTQLLSMGHFNSAGIVLSTGQIVASTPGFMILPNEIQKISMAFMNPSYIYQQGILVGGRHYVVTRADHSFIYGNCGDLNIIIAYAPRGIIIGIYSHMTPLYQAENAIHTAVSMLLH